MRPPRPRTGTYAAVEAAVSKALAPCQSLLRYLRSAGLSLARSAGLEPATFSVRSHFTSQTGRDSGGGQGETKLRFHKVLALLEGHGGTGRDTRLRSDCGQNTNLYTAWYMSRSYEPRAPQLLRSTGQQILI